MQAFRKVQAKTCTVFVWLANGLDYLSSLIEEAAARRKSCRDVWAFIDHHPHGLADTGMAGSTAKAVTQYRLPSMVA